MAGKVFRRVSDLVFVQGAPRALFRWINLGGVRTPLYVFELDPSRLRKISYDTYLYDGITEDPRFQTLLPEGQPRQALRSARGPTP